MTDRIELSTKMFALASRVKKGRYSLPELDQLDELADMFEDWVQRRRTQLRLNREHEEIGVDVRRNPADSTSASDFRNVARTREGDRA